MGCTGSKADVKEPAAPAVIEKADDKVKIEKVNKAEEKNTKPDVSVPEASKEPLAAEEQETTAKETELSELEKEFPKDTLKGVTLSVPEGCEEVELPRGLKYIGEWHNGKQHGMGKMIYPDGGYFLGQFEKGYPHGVGEFKNGADEAMYKGAFVEGKAHGYGVYHFPDGSKSYGYFENDKRHGRGWEILPDGQEYIGQFTNNAKEGNGILKAQNDEQYVGEFKLNDLSGKGVYTWPNGNRYDGEWELSQQHGQATFTWADGRVYKGEYKNGKMNGQGVITWTDGRKYDGEWKNGTQNGKGKYYATPASYREVQFLDGVRVKWLSEPIKVDGSAVVEETINVKTGENASPHDGEGGMDAFIGGKAVDGGLKELIDKKAIS
ncbi:MAG: uncharacterized protein KVP18_004597 [Porospora cf. gigantea A]|uniref:uncharacterized protein n=1 Tax=Porospora cf. gigantea A TaxID=2853593 RepID=UPI00355A4E3F|nr:MAG: hypothetical protein KVP18_004597 [Porospora cf. gigantea A]